MRTVLFFSILIALAITSCKKDHTSICNPVPLPNNGGPSTGWNFIKDSAYFSSPCFNPNNANEFIFSLQPYGLGKTKLCKFNMQTHQLFAIIEATILFPAKWGKNDWILLSLGDQNIWKIKSTGDSLTQLTFSSSNFSPYWNYTYDTIGFYNTTSGTTTTYLIDQNGRYIDTLHNGGLTNVSCWNSPKFIATSGCISVNLTIPRIDSFIVLYTLPNNNNGCGNGITFTDENTLIWSWYSGIYETSLADNSTKQILSGCDSRLYLSPSYSPLSNKILWNKVVETPLNNTDLEIKSSIVIMDSQGENEREIAIHN